MKRRLGSAFPALAALALLPCCAGLPGESPDHMRQRLARPQNPLLCRPQVLRQSKGRRGRQLLRRPALRGRHFQRNRETLRNAPVTS